MSYFLTRYLAKKSVDIVRSAIEDLLGSELTGRRPNLHLVIIGPDSDEILWEESFGGDQSTWQRPYDEIARSKAGIVKRTGMTLRTLEKDAPWLYQKGDTRYVGGVTENGLVIAASGLQDYFDEMISRMVLSAIQALCRDVLAKIPDNFDFFV